MNQYHIFQMKDAKHGLGIATDASKTTKKLGRQVALFSCTLQQCLLQKIIFFNNPKLVRDIISQKERVEKDKINKLIKKHR